MKRFLSMVLTLALVLSLIPAVFAAVETESKVYSFWNKSLLSSVAAVQSLTYEQTGGWQYVTTSTGSLGTGASNVSLNTSAGRIRVFANKWIAFKLQVPETINGKYDVSVNANRGSNSTGTADKIQVYLFKTDSVTGETDADKVKAGMSANSPLESDVISDVSADKDYALLGIKELEAGEYYFVFKASMVDKYFYLNSLTLTKKSDEEVIADAFTTEEPTVTTYNPSVDGVGYNVSEGKATVKGIEATLQTEGENKGTYKMSAPEKHGDAQFLYWAKGLSANKKIVSYENEFYYTPAGGDNNILIAVYDEADGTSNKAEFYNANGQLIKLITDETADKTVPALPSMAGYNSASSWKQYNGETAVTVGENIEPTGTMIFVAQYESKKQITVTVENGNGTNTVPYGEFVTCTPNALKGKLKWWKKEVNGVSEIVSIDEEYSFRAWENCTVTAEYAEAKPQNPGNTMKIIIDTFSAGNEKAVMAEFIGFGEDAVEKGIMLGTQKIAMTKPGNQFTVTGEVGDTFKGYAIVKNGDAFNLIVDGEATIK